MKVPWGMYAALILLATPVRAATAPVVVRAAPVEATRVSVRPVRSDQPFVQVASATPARLELDASQHYDIQVEAADGFFKRYHGLYTNVAPGFTAPLTIVMSSEWNGGRVALAGLPLAALLLGAAGFRWYRQRQQLTLVIRQKDEALTSMAQEQADKGWLVGTTVSTHQGRRFELLQVLGEGGMGVVLRARSVDDDSAWAVKFLVDENAGENELHRFQREAEICHRLHHPGMVQVLDWGVMEWPRADGTSRTMPFMVMELVPGESLRRVLKTFAASRVPVFQALSWVIEVLRTLQIAHDAGVIHRDLKPENLMIGPSGHVKILDFGLAHRNASVFTRTGTTMGTPVYMAPEQVDAAKTTPASDVYSMGTILYEMLAGRRPWDEAASDGVWQLLTRKLVEDPESLSLLRPDLPSGLSDVVDRMLAREPSERYLSAAAAAAALEPFLDLTG